MFCSCRPVIVTLLSSHLQNCCNIRDILPPHHHHNINEICRIRGKSSFVVNNSEVVRKNIILFNLSNLEKKREITISWFNQQNKQENFPFCLFDCLLTLLSASNVPSRIESGQWTTLDSWGPQSYSLTVGVFTLYTSEMREPCKQKIYIF